MHGRKFALFALSLLGAGCSLIFDGAGGESGGPGNGDGGAASAEPCLGVQRVFLRGDALESGNNPTRFQHVDYARGTMTFWARSLKDIPGGSDVLLADLAGITLSTNAAGEFIMTMPGLSQPVTFTGETHTWEPNADVFIALRWDVLKNVSGAPGVDARAMLRVGEGEGSRLTGVDGTFTPVAGTVEEIRVGDADGVFHVDQFTVYNRPLQVEREGDPELELEDDLRALAASKNDSPTLARGGFDVIFATSSPMRGGCDNHEEVAWRMPSDNLAPGTLGLGDFMGWSGGNTVETEIADRVYKNALVIAPSERSTADVTLVSGASYTYYVLTHAAPREASESEAIPYFAIYPLDGPNQGFPIVDRSAFESYRDFPETLFGTFTMPLGLVAARLEVGSHDAADTNAFFHTVVIRRNYIEDPGFEETYCKDGDCSFAESAWDQRGSDTGAGAVVKWYDGHSNTGEATACFTGIGNRNELRPSYSESLQLVDGEFYAMGSAAYWGSTSEAKSMGVRAGNSTFYATGAPQESGRRAFAFTHEQDDWFLTGTAAYRFTTEGGANNDVTIFGPNVSQPEHVSDGCIDDAYLFPLEKIGGAASP